MTDAELDSVVIELQAHIKAHRDRYESAVKSEKFLLSNFCDGVAEGLQLAIGVLSARRRSSPPEPPIVGYDHAGLPVYEPER